MKVHLRNVFQNKAGLLILIDSLIRFEKAGNSIENFTQALIFVLTIDRLQYNRSFF